MTAVQFLAEWALRSSILILSGALLLWVLRVKDPSIRLMAWTAMLCGSLAIPAITVAMPKVPLAIIRVATQPVEVPAVLREAIPTQEPTVFHQAVSYSRPFDWALTALIAYVVIADSLLLRLSFGLATSLRLLRSSCSTGHATEGIEIRESDRVASPVALGIVHPSILLPIDWRDWSAAKLDAVLAHERSHTRRHDPAVQLLSALHRALLWHSPLSWFLHQRIVRVAEEASDDAAVAAALDRASYAEMLLDFMQRGVRSANWQGVPMARYGAPAERIHRILDGTALSRGVTRWSIVAIFALGAPLAYLVAAAQATAQQGVTGRQLNFDVASVKPAIVPDGVTVSGGAITVPRGSGISIPRNTGGPGTDDPGRIHYPPISLKDLLRRGYDSYVEIVSPGWLDDDLLQVDATMPPDTTKAQLAEMLRNLITSRFNLKYHTETKQITGYALVVARNGSKMKESVEDPTPQGKDDNDAQQSPRPRQIGPDGFGIPRRVVGPALRFQGEPGDRARMLCQQQTMQDLARALGRLLKSTVTDATGLTAKYDFTVTYAGSLGGPRLTPAPPSGGTATNAPEAAPLPDIFSALQAQLGLKLEPKKVAVETLIVDHVEKMPTGN